MVSSLLFKHVRTVFSIHLPYISNLIVTTCILFCLVAPLCFLNNRTEIVYSLFKRLFNKLIE